MNKKPKPLKNNIPDTKKEDFPVLGDSMFRYIIENSFDAVLLYDGYSHCIYASPSVKEMGNYTYKDIKTLEIENVVHPEDIKILTDEIKNAIDKRAEKSGITFRAKHKNGSFIWIECIFRRKYNKVGNVIETFVNCRDVTEYKNTDSLIAESEEKLRNIFNSSPEAIVISSADFRFTDCNSEALKLFGYERKEFLKLDPVFLVDEKNHDQFSFILGKLKIKNFIKNHEIIFLKKNGETFNGLISANAVLNSKKETKYYILVVQDISKFRKVEAELINAKEKAEESDELKSAFLANMSHEIRTPMNAIIGFSDLLSDPSLDQSEIGVYTGIIKERCNNLLQIVNDILDISRIEANQIELKENKFSVNSLLDELYIIYAQKLINEEKLKVVLNISKDRTDDQSTIFADEVRLKQVLCNLLDNAIKFTKSGEIEFGYKAVDNNFLEFFVRDTGIGISPEKHQIIFERFRQIDESLDREYGGNGLGLAICKAFVELLQGRIWLQSAPGTGTTFFFTLPDKKVSEKESLITGESKIANYKWNNKRILIVEDDKASLAFMKVLFKLTQADMEFASRGQEAVDIFMKDRNFDLIIMDIQLPDINGLEVTKMIKSIDRTIPVIAQTAYAMYGDEIKCKNAGCDDYVSKPLDISELFYKINMLIHKES